MQAPTRYPTGPGDRNRWIERLRSKTPGKSALNPWIPYAFLEEEEHSAAGSPIPTATIFLTNRECPYRCLMCDLWRNTLNDTVPPGAIAEQIRYALERMPRFACVEPARKRGAQIKLYNAGSFFDPRAIPPQDYPEIVSEAADFGRVIVECHPALIGARTLEFKQMLTGRLEVAIGLETAHPDALDKLNKRFTLEDFQRAASFLADNDIDLRVFLLLNPPFLSPADGLDWAKRSLAIAFDSGASTCCIIPTRGGNGAMEQIAATGHFTPPSLSALEAAVEYGLQLQRGRVFADLWDLDRFHTCQCAPARARRLEAMNQTQTAPPPVQCELCRTS